MELASCSVMSSMPRISGIRKATWQVHLRLKVLMELSAWLVFAMSSMPQMSSYTLFWTWILKAWQALFLTLASGPQWLTRLSENGTTIASFCSGHIFLKQGKPLGKYFFRG
jgi:hypothetical protein